ncbi:hypothetical protein PC122_g22839 [Phytophthora cactorum]|nr:hypothetical protein PC122_g22839 [Phytophthora cactorum]
MHSKLVIEAHVLSKAEALLRSTDTQKTTKTELVCRPQISAFDDGSTMHKTETLPSTCSQAEEGEQRSTLRQHVGGVRLSTVG